MSDHKQDTAQTETKASQSGIADANLLQVDVQEDYLYALSPDILNALLNDHTTSTPEEQHNIFWATSDYAHLGNGYQYTDPILMPLITGKNGHVIMPRVLKSKHTQSVRVRNMAEVFTPSWICNTQNNLIDEAWFGRKNVFNSEHTDPAGLHYWTTNHSPITFPEGKSWHDYVNDVRLEITCGEAPYIVSRYDTTTGKFIPIADRIGLLDRKLRVVSENTSTSAQWLYWAQKAYKSIYAYEWQGDNLLIAREAMLFSFMEYYQQKFDKLPQTKSVKLIAYIISWNVWQMDGLKGVVPNSCSEKYSKNGVLFFEAKPEPCQGCKSGDIRKHNGTYCLIKDWRTKKKENQKIRFIDLINMKKI